MKCSDFMTAEFCQSCDDLFGEHGYHHWPGGSKSVERSEEFLHWIAMTNIRRFESGTVIGLVAQTQSRPGPRSSKILAKEGFV